MKINRMVIMKVTPHGDDVFQLKVVPMDWGSHRFSRRKLMKSLVRLVDHNDPREIGYVLQLMGENEEETIIFPRGDSLEAVLTYINGLPEIEVKLEEQ